ncbi:MULTISPECIES: acylphosphatase [Mammaliicoccus]|uniref:acylphosphatase n=1 Tax=Mammaliicoccus fleurettii TaxID=150056 RepID=A0ABS5MK55_9STAP|nr:MULTISPECIES: acylphosphatase [Mammaliicoccus]HCN59780.1 acylphosphatase [Staphylococcus sp.]MBL0846061.1 acylphosphatase [Mammaliicoccus fleurettii]MBO3062575.1 acylphosphatase [Mammaliicoccus fleurettii]MBS3671337.1 acylphosphatase [Mammaliicoccus fleurettii]MBS3696288.1 acylphosphatase [Mammaliicoccus fleurettii]
MNGKHIKVFGRVQGVGFRFFTAQLAKKYKIVGSVENVSDYVEIYASGNDDNLEQFINGVIQGAAPASVVENYTIDDTTLDEKTKHFKTL